MIEPTTTARATPATQAASPLVLPEYRRDLALASAAVLAACVLMVIALALPPAAQLKSPRWLDVSLHTLVSTVSMVVAALVFSVGWYTFGRQRSSSVALVCSAFLAAAVLEFAHLISFDGMPAFMTPSGSGKVIVFYLAGRLVLVLALLVLALMPWERPISPGARSRLLAVSLGIATAVAIVGLVDPELRLWFYRAGPTTLKIGVSYGLVALGLAAALSFLRLLRRPRRAPAVSLFAASLLLALSDLTFTLYAAASDAFALLGHLFQVTAYLLVYRALFVNLVRMPYLRLEAARQTLEELNATLEQRVRERTAELQAANQELEHFAHAVAHDLRSPLAATAGFGAALARELGEPGDRARHLLARMAAGVARMEETIQALLELTQLSSSPVRREPLDLSALARQLLAAWQEREPGRAVHLDVQDGMLVEGDRRLVTVALENLIGNAWKFTGGRPQARIAVGAERSGGELVCFVRDNGAGFDMAYAGKLFVAFQRLHPASEFPGHGIGLASVQRIVARHGGRIWAEAAPGAGATFRFTLAPPA